MRTAHGPLLAGGLEGRGHRDGGRERRGDGLVTRFFPERYFYYYEAENFRLERQWWMTVKYGVGPSLLGIVSTVIVFWLWIL